VVRTEQQVWGARAPPPAHFGAAPKCHMGKQRRGEADL
jgi:hypothetical protein